MSNARVESGIRMPLAASVVGTLADNWWLLLLRGLAAIAFGAIAFFWPGVTLVALTYVWGAYAIADGIIAIGAAIGASGSNAGPRWWLGLSGIVGILAGIVAFAYTGMTALVLLMFIAAWAIIIGALELYAAAQLRKVIDNAWWLILGGLFSIAFGAVLIAWPGTGALAVIWTIAWYAVFFGCMLIGLSFELKKFKRT
jgi:uncharacterized membrane protein HdeD (DUF308 family)